MDTYTEDYLEKYNAKFSQHVLSAGYYYKSDQPEGINIGLASGVVDPHFIKTTVMMAEVMGHLSCQKVKNDELSIEQLVGMTEELIKEVKNQPTSMLSAEKLEEHKINIPTKENTRMASSPGTSSLFCFSVTSTMMNTMGIRMKSMRQMQSRCDP